VFTAFVSSDVKEHFDTYITTVKFLSVEL